MERRLFFKKSCSAVCLLAYPGIFPSANGTKARFGLMTDIHFADCENLGSRHYRDSSNKLLGAIKVFRREQLDFLIELGDLKDQGDPPEKTETLRFLDEIEKTFQSFNGPVYHALGNHDMDSISKKEFLSHTNNHGTANGQQYYSFIQKGIKFIVLDANFNKDDSDYDSGNFDWTFSKIPDHELKWLINELSMNDLPVVVFIHQLLDSFSGITELVCVKNAREVITILEKNKNVIAVFQGHRHEGHYSFRSGIHYFTMKAMVEGALPDNNSYAIIEIDNDLNISIDGFYNCEDLFLKNQLQLSLRDK